MMAVKKVGLERAGKPPLAIYGLAKRRLLAKSEGRGEGNKFILGRRESLPHSISGKALSMPWCQKTEWKESISSP